LENRHRTIDELVDLSGLSWSYCQRILSEKLQMKRVAAKFVPHVLTADQKQSRVDVCCELKEHLEIDPDLFSKVITGDESWCYAYDPETKQQSSKWKSSNSPCTKKSAASAVKCQDDADFFYANGTVHSELVPNGQTVNQAFYLQVLKRLHDAVRQKRPELWQSWVVVASPRQRASAQILECETIFNPKQHDRAYPLAIFTRSHSVRLLFFPRKKKMTEALKGITLQEFQDCFKKWKTRLDQCIASNGQYFEGYSICNT
jgi:histone-lysine N-methyltransferase SETMAR